MSKSKSVTLIPADAHRPHPLVKRLGREAPAELHALGNPDLVAQSKTALFCSAHCPGSAILADEVWFAHLTPGGQLSRLAKTVAGWRR